MLYSQSNIPVISVYSSFYCIWLYNIIIHIALKFAFNDALW